MVLHSMGCGRVARRRLFFWGRHDVSPLFCLFVFRVGVLGVGFSCVRGRRVASPLFCIRGGETAVGPRGCGTRACMGPERGREATVSPQRGMRSAGGFSDGQTEGRDVRGGSADVEAVAGSGARVRGFDLGHEPGYDDVRHRFHVDVDGGERRNRYFPEGGTVESGHLDVARHGQSDVGESTYRSQCDDVGHGEDAVERRSGVEEFDHRPSCLIVGPVDGMEHDLHIPKPGLANRFHGAQRAQSSHGLRQ